MNTLDDAKKIKAIIKGLANDINKKSGTSVKFMSLITEDNENKELLEEVLNLDVFESEFDDLVLFVAIFENEIFKLTLKLYEGSCYTGLKKFNNDVTIDHEEESWRGIMCSILGALEYSFHIYSKIGDTNQDYEKKKDEILDRKTELENIFAILKKHLSNAS